MTLTEFLLARIAEDEAILDAQRDGQSSAEGAGYWAQPMDDALRRHEAECEAKRRIISRCDMVLRGRGAGMFNDGQATDAADNLRSLALPYSDHPDYREEWRP